MDTYNAVLGFLEQNNLQHAAVALRSELQQSNKYNAPPQDPNAAKNLQKTIHKALDNQTKSEVQKKIKDSFMPENNRKPFKTLSPEETETVMEGFLGKLINNPNLLEDEKLNARIEKLFDNPTFQRIVENTDVQDVSNLSIGQQSFTHKLPNVGGLNNDSKKGYTDSSWNADVPRFGGSMEGESGAYLNESNNPQRADQNQKLQVSENMEDMQKKRSPSMEDIFMTGDEEKPEGGRLTKQDTKESLGKSMNKSDDRSALERLDENTGKISIIQSQPQKDESSFLNNTFVISALEDQFQNAIDEYTDDDDPGFDLYEVAERDFVRVAKQLADKYQFPERAVAPDRHKSKEPEKDTKKKDFTPTDESGSILKELDKKSTNKDDSKIEEKGYIHLPSVLKHPPSNDDFYPVKFDNVIYDCFNLKVIFDRERTGFEETKDFPIVINSVIAGRYQILQYLGSAAFSKAIECLDLVTQKNVCMKVIENNKDYYDQSIDEIKLLKFINFNGDVDDKNVLRFHDYFYHKEHLFIVTELLKENLYEWYKLTRDNDPENYYTIPRLQRITRQVLTALDYLHGLHLIHCDLKPENILMKDYENADVKVIDFGSSCFIHDHLSSYVQSRSYRAPEVIIGCKYDYKIDMWSLGCILAELFTGNVLFQNDTVQGLLSRVIGIVGPFPDKMMKDGRLVSNFFTKEKLLYQEAFEDGDSHGYMDNSEVMSRRKVKTGKVQILVPKRSSLKHRLRTNDPYFLDFVRCLLEIDPSKRPTAREALNHPWLTEAKYQEVPYKRNAHMGQKKKRKSRPDPNAFDARPDFGGNAGNNGNNKSF